MLWLANQPKEHLFIPSIVFLELQRGVELTRLQDTARAAAIERWVDEIAGSSNVLSFDLLAARAYSRLKRSKPDFVSEDAMIAAIAKTRGLTVVTRNIRDFDLYDVPTLNPFETSRKPST